MSDTAPGNQPRPSASGGEADWPSVNYGDWSATCDTLHAHLQVLGKLAAALAPPEPQLQHAALRMTARGCETSQLPAPDGSGAIVIGLDLHAHDVFIEHSAGAGRRIALTPHRAVGTVTTEVMDAVTRLAGPVQIDPAPQEVWWTAALDEDQEHATYDTTAVARYFTAATRAALVLAEFRAPYRGRSTPVNAWWGSFDLAVNMFSGAARRSPIGRLHHAQRDGRSGGRDRMVAGRSSPLQGRVLRLRSPGTAGLHQRDTRAPRGPLGRSAR